MIDTLLALIPQYGLALIFATVALSCLAIPLPASALVLGAGAFAAAGDLVAWQVIGAAFAGFTLGDQIAYRIGRNWGTPVMGKLKKRKAARAPIARAEKMIAKSGPLAVFLSRTVLSPLGPYMSYLCGAGGLRWPSYTAASLPGAALWAACYTAFGYGVADQLEPSAALVWNLLGLLAACAVIVVAGIWIKNALRRFRKEQAAQGENAAETA